MKVEKDAVIKLIQNYYHAPLPTSSYEDRKLLLDNIITAIKCMKAGDSNG